MFTRFFLCILLSAAAGPAAAANNDSVWMDLGYPAKAAKAGTSRTASQLDINRLKGMRPRPSVKCARIEYVHQCLSSQPMTLIRTACRAGQTEAQCCANARTYVTTKICGPLWDRLKKAGKTYYPGIFLCKCVETARTLKKLPDRPIRPR